MSKRLSVVREVVKIPVEKICFQANNPRLQMIDDPDLDDLGASIKQTGQIEEVRTRPCKIHEGHYEIVAGERRARSIIKKNLPYVEGSIEEMDDEKASHLRLVENVRRKNLDSIELAHGYKAHMKLTGKSEAETAKEFGYNLASFKNILRIEKGLSKTLKYDHAFLRQVPADITAQMIKYRVEDQDMIAERVLIPEKFTQRQARIFFDLYDEDPELSRLDEYVKKAKEKLVTIQVTEEEATARATKRHKKVASKKLKEHLQQPAVQQEPEDKKEKTPQELREEAIEKTALNFNLEGIVRARYEENARKFPSISLEEHARKALEEYETKRTVNEWSNKEWIAIGAYANAHALIDEETRHRKAVRKIVLQALDLKDEREVISAPSI